MINNGGMPVSAIHRWSLRLVTLLLWVACGASVVYWGLRLSRPGAFAAAPAPVSEPASIDVQALSRMLGAGSAAPAAPEPTAPARLVLHGVLAGTRSGHGAALIAVDGKPPKTYRVGAAVEPGLVVQSLGAREARLGKALDGPATMTLKLPGKS